MTTSPKGVTIFFPAVLLHHGALRNVDALDVRRSIAEQAAVSSAVRVRK